MIFPNNETAVLLVYQAKPVGHEVFSFVNAFFCLKNVEYNLWVLAMQVKKLCIIRNTSRKKSKHQMGFEPTTLRDLVGCSNL